jgi:flagellar biosynthetic protein FliP
MPRITQLRTRSSHHSQEPTLACTAIDWGALARHYLEMVVTMVVGMMVLHPLWGVGFDALRLPDALDHANVMALAMATDMSLGMGVWMRYRGHSWRSIVEMSATMYLPFAVFLPSVLAGAMSGGAMITAGHLLMLPTMLALMLWRRDEYRHRCHRPSHAEPATAKPVIATENALA